MFGLSTAFLFEVLQEIWKREKMRTPD